MKGRIIAAVALTVSAVPAVCWSADGARIIASINANGWIVFGSNQTHEKVADATVPGKAAIRISVPNDGGPTGGATGQSVVKADIKQGDTVRVTAWFKGVSTVSGGPARAIVKLKDADKPYKPYGEKAFELTRDWKPYSIDYVAERDFPARSLNIVVQVALGRQTVDVGPASAEILTPARQ